MKTRLLIAASALAIVAGAPAFAANETNAAANANVNANQSTSGTVSHDVKKGWENTKDAVSSAADKTADATKNAYENIKAKMFGGNDTNASGAVVTFDSRTTAKGMIGSPVYNAANKKIATVHDIILDPQGKAAMVVVSDGGFLGIGSKYAAFDYSLVSQRMKDGDVIMPLTDETIKKAAEFSYDKTQTGKAGVRVIPEGGLSANTLLKGQLVDQKNQTVAQVDNIVLQNGAAADLIVAFNQSLGIGGDKAAIPFTNVRAVQQDKKGNNIDFQMTAEQTAQFETFKKTMSN